MACAVATELLEPSGDFPAWLEAQGVNAEVAQAMDSELGIRDYEVLRACVGDGLVRAELLATARDRLPFGFYAVLRQVVKALQGAETHDGETSPLWDDDAAFSPGDVTLGGLVEALIELFSGLSRELMLCVQRLREWDGGNFTTVSSAAEDERLGTTGVLGTSAGDSTLTTRAATPMDAADELVDCAAEGAADELQVLSDELVSDDQMMTTIKVETGNRSTRRKPARTRRQRANATQKGGRPGNRAQPHLAAGEGMAEETLGSNIKDFSSNQERAVKVERYDGKRNSHDQSRFIIGDVKSLRSARADAPRIHNFRWPPRTHEQPAGRAGCSSNMTATTGMYASEQLAMGSPLNWGSAGKDEATPANFSAANDDQPTTAPARYGCTVCGKTFSMRCNLTHHQRLHTGEKPYRCKLCGQEFSRMGTLKLHERTHTGEKPYRCEMCNQDFSQMGSLKRHQRKHTCGQSFAWKNALKEQERMRAGEMPFGCDDCGQLFAQSSSLRFHQCKHAGAPLGFNEDRRPTTPLED